MVRYAFRAKENPINIGIDLGTTNSAVAVLQNSSARVCKVDIVESDIFPSAIYKDQLSGREYYGMVAYNKIAMYPQNVATAFKRELGTSWEFAFKGTTTIISAEECCVKILQQLVKYAKVGYENQDIDGVVITVPAAFSQLKREATMRVAEKAGIPRVALLEEPIASSMAIMDTANSKDTQFLVYDIGGGTLDLAIVSCVRGSINAIGFEGVELFGGRDFDRMITDSIVCPWLVEKFALPANIQASKKYSQLIRKLTLEAEKAKIVLSTNEEAIIGAYGDAELGVDENYEDIFVEIPIKREDFEKLISDKIFESVLLANKLLNEHGYTSHDMDKVVFIGGPTKTPCIREIVSNELGLPADMSVDPMTAVALGAAIYSESRDWQSSKNSIRKQSKTRQVFQGNIGLDVVFSSRVTTDSAQVKLRALDGVEKKKLKFQIESESGWNSGYFDLESEVRIDIPVRKKGEHKYRIIIVDSNYDPIDDLAREIVVTRVAASVPVKFATHAIAIKVAEEEGRNAENTLDTIIKKGMQLPAEGIVPYRTNKDVGVYSDNEQLIIELFEQTDENNKTIGEPNLFIGSCVIRSEDLGGEIHKGNKVNIHWNIDENGLIRAAVELPSVNKIFDSHNFYESQLASSRRVFGGETGKVYVTNKAMDAKKEAEVTLKIVAASQSDSVRKLVKEINEQLDVINSHIETEPRQQADNKIREIRQKLSALRNDPINKARMLWEKLQNEIDRFEWVREKVDATIENRFDELVESAEVAINSGDKDVKKYFEAIDSILGKVYYPSLEYQVRHFHYLATQRSQAINLKLFDSHVDEGQQAVMNDDNGQLRSINSQMRSNIIFSSDKQEKGFAADIMKL